MMIPTRIMSADPDVWPPRKPTTRLFACPCWKTKSRRRHVSFAAEPVYNSRIIDDGDDDESDDDSLAQQGT